MVRKVDTATVHLWGTLVGAVSWLEDKGYAVFEFDPTFLRSGLDVSPIYMSTRMASRGNSIFQFPTLSKGTFFGLPGMLADSLPDKYGNAVIDAWLSQNGRAGESFSPVERLCYMGNRGMGALEFRPAMAPAQMASAVPVDVAEMVALAQDVMKHRQGLDVSFGESEQKNGEALKDILRVGTSAGGARPKAVIAVNKEGRVVSGQVDAPAGYDHWIIKFDSVTDVELGETKGFGRIEYAYHLLAKAADIKMTECRLLEENERAHFITRRFDRVNGKKIHMQSLCGLAHYDFNMPGAYSYEQAFEIMRKLRLPKADAEQLYRRMIFNIVTRNQDDHTKNISFLMDHNGTWSLAPAYDVTYSHNPKGLWTNKHQMSVNGKRGHFTRKDLVMVGQSINITNPEQIIDHIVDVVAQWWPIQADKWGVAPTIRENIAKQHRLYLGGRGHVKSN